MLAAVRNSVNQNPVLGSALNLLKPQYSLRWFFVEMTLKAIAVACFAYFQRSETNDPAYVLFQFLGFFSAACAAVGGLVHHQVVGGICGLVLAFGLWIAFLPVMLVP